MSDDKSTEPAWPKGVGQPAIRAFALIGIHRLTELEGRSERELADLHGVGPKSLRIINQTLREQGLRPLT